MVTEFIDKRPKFGSVFIQDSSIYLHNAIKKEDVKDYEAAQIYAFDNLIYNVDRKPTKPNLLFKSEEYYLIDHELSLHPINRNYLENIQNEKWIYPYERHLFHNYLKQLNDKSDLFSSFTEILKRFPIKCINDTASQLLKLEYKVNNLNVLVDYFRFIKTNCCIFEKQLLKQI